MSQIQRVPADQLMNIKLETKYNKLERLVKWEHAEEVNKMLLSGISPIQVANWCEEHGFKISHPKLYEYRDMLQEAITRQITIERLLGIGLPKRKPIVLSAIAMQNTKQLVKNELEVLDGIIQMGMNALYASPTVKLQDAMKAIELKQKLTGGKHSGLTSYGLDQLRAVEQAKFQAIVDVVMKYLPEDKHEELEAAIATAERQYYEQYAPELIEEYEKAIEEQYGTDDDIVVSDTKF
jgi:hypothetical protein